MKRRVSFPVDMKSALAGALKSVNQTNVLTFARIQSKWIDIVGPQLAAVSKPAGFKRKVVTVWVSEPVWMDTMLYMERQIIAKLNALFASPVVSKVKIIHKSGFDTGGSTGGTAEDKEDDKSSPLSDSEIKEIDSAVAGLPDSQLRSSFKRVMLKDGKLRIKRSRR
ncbi:hypothetical protein MNBD_NITROSPINAE03-1251 [hydrothermal vent metagenome]|uniref:Zn-ribbon-containing, possibly RNA-binding protein and truncated derivatives n=1 Tax=hydrothermal vent metagenome TaxID=652676 RepID=A0A3B1CKA3_9ZZZZ